MQFKLNFEKKQNNKEKYLKQNIVEKEAIELFNFYKNPETVNLNFDHVLEDLKKLSEGRLDESSLSENERSLEDMASYYYKDFERNDFIQLYNEILQKISDDKKRIVEHQAKEETPSELEIGHQKIDNDNPFNLSPEELKRYNESDASDLYRDMTE